MGKIKEYIVLSKDVHEKRNLMRASKAKITSYHKEYFIDDPKYVKDETCINKFEQVYGICMDSKAYDEHGDFTKLCSLFDAMEPCINRKCLLFADNLDYIVARERYEKAISKRREFIRNLFNKKSK